MNDDEIFSQRWLSNEAHGDLLLVDEAEQQRLGFSWTGDTIVDRLTGLEYFYPSTIGTALFFHGSFEAGEIAVVCAALRDCVAPVILDIGANIGVHTVAWAKALPEARIFALEPVASNRAVLARNAERAGVANRIEISTHAAAAQSGFVELAECEDAAYSTIGPRPAISVRNRYEVPAITLDDYVAQHDIARVDLIKIDVEGEDAAVLQGARALLERDAPLLLIEVSAPELERESTLDRLRALGYTAYSVTDGLIAPAISATRRAANFLFVPPSRAFIPTIDPAIAREEAAYRQRIIEQNRRQLVQLRIQLREKDREIHDLKAAAEERLALIDRLTESIAALQRRHELPGPASDGELVARLRGFNAELHEEVERQHQAATERLALIEDMERRMRALGDQVRDARDAAERFRAVADERLGVIERVQTELHAREAELAAKGAIIEKLDAMVAARHDDAAEVRETLVQTRARVEELELLAEERLQVIRAMKSGKTA